MIQTTTIKIDISRPNIPAVVYAKQHDADTRVIEVSLYDNGVAYNPPYESSGIVNIAKPDGTGCYYDVDDITGNKVTFTLIEQALTAAGTAHAEISLVTANEERLTSFSFDIIIEARVLEDSVIVSSDYYNALLEASSAYIQHATLLKVKGYYATVEALEAAITEPMGGDIYAVGSTAPYNIYIYDPVSEQWIDNGTIGQSGTIYLGQTTGTADALTITGYSGTIPDGYTFTIKPHVNVNTGATLKIGSGSAIPLLSNEGTPIASNTLFQNVPITLIYRQTPTPAYITVMDTETVMLATGMPTVEDHGLVWVEGAEDIRGYYVNDVSLKSGSTEPGDTAVYSMKLNDPDETEIGTFSVYNGVDGTVTGLTASKAVVTDSNGEVTTSSTTATEIGYLSGVTSAIQTQLNDLKNSNAAAHNSIYRGKYLGSSVTTAQWNAISSGSFTDLYVGDYWTIGNRNWLIAAFDYWYRYGDENGDYGCTTHHVVIVPESYLLSGNGSTTHWMNSTNTTAGAYVGSDFYTGNNSNTGKSQCTTIINNAFGSSHILSHKEFLANAVTNGYESGANWYNSTIELMSEQMVYGSNIFKNTSAGTAYPKNHTTDFSQFPLFFYNRSVICIRWDWWLRDVVSETMFAKVEATGYCDAASAGFTWPALRPVFAIKA